MFIITIHLFILRVYQILTRIIGQHKNPTWNKWQAVNAWNVPSAFSVRLGLESSLCAAVRAETFQGYKSLPSKSFRKIRSWFEQNTTSAPTIWWNSVNNISYALMIIMVKGAFYECVRAKLGAAWIEAITKTTFHVKRDFCGHSPPGNVVYFDLSYSCLTFLVWAPEVPSNSAVMEKLYWNVVFISYFLRKSAFSQKGQM